MAGLEVGDKDQLLKVCTETVKVSGTRWWWPSSNTVKVLNVTKGKSYMMRILSQRK